MIAAPRAALLGSMATRARTFHGRESLSLGGRPTLAPPSWWDSLARGVSSPAARMFAAGLAIRVAFLTLARAYVFRDSFGFGFEAGRIARALAAGRGFS